MTKAKPQEEGLVKPDPQPLANMPAYFEEAAEMGGAGLENVEQRDMKIPRLGLCQSMTPQRKRDEPSYIKGLEEGYYFNTVTSEIYGEKLNVVPLLFFKNRARFKPMTEGGGLVCISRDYMTGVGDPGGRCEVCPMSQFVDGKPPQCNENFNFAVIVLPKDGRPSPSNLAVLTLKRTALNIAKTWNSLMRTRTLNGRAMPAFAGVYELASAVQKNPAGQSWHQVVIHNAMEGDESRWADDHAFRLAKGLYTQVKQMNEAGKLKVEGDDEFTGAEVHREPGADDDIL